MILGASARAAAFSVRRAGYEPVAADRFADWDLRGCCDVSLVTDYPRGLVRFARQRPGLPWMYTGALENEPAVVDAISRGRPLWGNPGRVLREVRCPVRVASALCKTGLHVPPLAGSVDEARSDGTWLSKPLASCGGSGIRTLNPTPADAAETVGGRDRYFQRRIEGVPCAAVFVAAGGRARLLGITRQLVGTGWTGAVGFQYAGSIGPLCLPDACVAQFLRAGDRLADRFQLQGLFGVDAIVAGPIVWFVEVNPRYTASVEVIERALGIDAVESHVEACCRACLRQTLPRMGSDMDLCGKAVVYATGNLITTDRLNRCTDAANDGRWPRYADIPNVGTEIRTGHPILTVLAHGPTEELVERRLRERVAAVRRWLS
jgi:predicted ATP-grasp superfamily ATP-dependent carboligase